MGKQELVFVSRLFSVPETGLGLIPRVYSPEFYIVIVIAENGSDRDKKDVAGCTKK